MSELQLQRFRLMTPQHTLGFLHSRCCVKYSVHPIDKFQINEINVDLRTSGFGNEVLSVDACAVW